MGSDTVSVAAPAVVTCTYMACQAPVQAVALFGTKRPRPAARRLLRQGSNHSPCQERIASLSPVNPIVTAAAIGVGGTVLVGVAGFTAAIWNTGQRFGRPGYERSGGQLDHGGLDALGRW